MGIWPPILAMGFTQLAMLGWLAAAAAPVLIHLWNRRQQGETRFAAMEFLLAAIQKNSRRLHIEQWLLLATRTAAIVAAVLAVAGLYLERGGDGFVPNQPAHKMIIVDGSYSMAYRPNEKSRFERAKELAAEIVAHSSQGDGFTLLLMASPPVTIIGQPAFDPAEVEREIENLRLHHGGADLEATLAAAEKIATDVKREQGRLTRQEIYVLSDLGRTSWSPEGTGRGRVAERIGRLSEMARMAVIDVGQSGGENLAVTGLSAGGPLATVGQPIRVMATIRNFVDGPRRTNVEMLVDGERVRSAPLEVAARGEASVPFTHRFDRPGDHLVEVRLGGDLLDVDNHRWLAMTVPSSVRTLIVNGEGDPREANYLRFALNPDSGRGDAAGGQTVEATVVAESAFLSQALESYDAVFFSNVGQFSAAEGGAIAETVRSGRGAAFFLGDRVLPDRYNAVLAEAGKGEDAVLPTRLVGAAEFSRYSFDPLGYGHPIVQVFAGNERAGLLATPISKYLRMARPAEGSRAETALAFSETGDPAILTSRIGRGRVAIIALPCSLASVERTTGQPWTLMPAMQSFQPIVQETLAWMLAGREAGRNVLVGGTLEGSLPPGESGSSVTIQVAQEEEKARAAVEGDARTWRFAETWWSGPYRATADGGGTGAVFGVNVDTVESDLTRVAAEDLPSELAVLGGWAELKGGSAGASPSPAGLERPLLYVLLSLLAAESAMAWWLGRRSG